MPVVERSQGSLRPWPRRSRAYDAQPRSARAVCQKRQTRALLAAPCTRSTGGRSFALFALFALFATWGRRPDTAIIVSASRNSHHLSAYPLWRRTPYVVRGTLGGGG